eukprot:gene7-21_t
MSMIQSFTKRAPAVLSPFRRAYGSLALAFNRIAVKSQAAPSSLLNPSGQQRNGGTSVLGAGLALAA